MGTDKLEFVIGLKPVAKDNYKFLCSGDERDKIIYILLILKLYFKTLIFNFLQKIIEKIVENGYNKNEQF